MDERVLQFRVGVVVFASVIIALILAFAFGELPTLVSGHYTVYVWFPEAPGVMVDTPVRRSGILVGRVKSVKLQKQKDGGGVLVTCRMDRSMYMIGPEDVCRVGSGSLFGDAVLEFTYKKKAAEVPPESGLPAKVTDGTWLRGEVTDNPFDVLVSMKGNMEDTLASIEHAGNKVGDLADTLNATVTDNRDQFQEIMDKTTKALDSFNKAMDAVNELVGDENLRNELRQSLRELPELLRETRQAVTGLKDNAENLQKFTEPLGKDGPQLVSDMVEGIGRLRAIMVRLDEFSRKLNTRDGTIGELVNDRELYDKLNRAATNIEDVSARLRPIVNDVRVFTDKIARDPGRLTEGVARGVFKRNSSGAKWVDTTGWSPHRDEPQGAFAPYNR